MVQVRGVAVLLPPGTHPAVWAGRRLLGLARLVLVGPPRPPAASSLSSSLSSSSSLVSSSAGLFASAGPQPGLVCAAALSNPRLPELGNFSYNCVTVVSSQTWSSLDETQKRDAPWSKGEEMLSSQPEARC